LSRKVNVTSVHNLLRHDQNRAKALMALGGAKEKGIFLEGAVINEQVENQAVSYIASVGVGSPPTICEFIYNDSVNVSLMNSERRLARY
jgi:cathepsin E